MLVGWMIVYLISYPVYSFLLPIYSFWCMDEFGWGNTRLVIGEGTSKKVMINEDEKFDESMIPLKKFSEYEAEAWETGSHHSEESYRTGLSKPRSRIQSGRDSPRSYQQASQSGDYYRDTNAMSNRNVRNPPSHSNGSHIAGQTTMSQYGGIPQLPPMPLGGGLNGSPAGSDYGGHMPMSSMPYQNTGSMYGMPSMMGAQQATMMAGLNMFGGPVPGGMSPSPSAMGVPPSATGNQRPLSTFSFATSVNPFAGPSQNPDPSDEELFQALRNYLSTQDLMTVTKKTAREAIMARFPRADLTSKKAFLNESIDKILSES